MVKTLTVVLPFPLLLLLAGCSSSLPGQQTQQLHREVGKLNQELSLLTLQATALELQARLNQNSLKGAWLVPAARTPVVLQSQAGEVRLWLSLLPRQDEGTGALLHLSYSGSAQLPALAGQLEWGSLDDSSGRPLRAESHSERFQVVPAMLPRSEATVRLNLRGFAPEKLGYVRVHGLTLNNSSSSAP